MILINGVPEHRINSADRGLQYGDGLFETIAFRHGKFEFIDAHLLRLQQGCSRLNIAFNELETLRDELNTVITQLDEDTIIKIIVTRGEGGRGYRPPSPQSPTRIISTHPMPDHSTKQHGITLRFCNTSLSINPLLAGIKHLNRLEQVIARAEWDDDSIAEGLMLDPNGYLIEGTMSNVFVVMNNTLVTPSLESCGVAGVMRQQLIELAKQLGISVQVRPIIPSELNDADELFVCNSVIGIWPVTQIHDTALRYALGPITQQLRSAITEQAQR